MQCILASSALYKPHAMIGLEPEIRHSAGQSDRLFNSLPDKMALSILQNFRVVLDLMEHICIVQSTIEG